MEKKGPVYNIRHSQDGATKAKLHATIAQMICKKTLVVIGTRRSFFSGNQRVIGSHAKWEFVIGHCRSPRPMRTNVNRFFFEISFGLWSQGLPPKRSRLHLYVGRPWPCLRSPRWAGETLGGNEKDMQWYAVHLGSWVALSTVQCDPLIWFTIMPGKKDLISPGWPYNRATFSNWDHKLISLKMIWNASDDAL